MSLSIDVKNESGRSHPTVTAYFTEDGSRRTVHRDEFNLNISRQRSTFAARVAQLVAVPAMDVETALLEASVKKEINFERVGGGEAPDDPHRLAKICLEIWTSNSGEPGLVYYHDEFYKFNGCHYLVISPKDIQSQVTSAIKSEFDRLASIGVLAPNGHTIKVTKRLLSDVMTVIVSLVKVSDDNQVPFWIDTSDTSRPPAKNLLATPSGIVDLEAFANGSTGLIPSTPAFCTVRGITFSADSRAECLNWRRFLGELWPNDPESIQLLQEWFGNVLTTDTSQQKMLMLCGPTRSGKGTIGRILRKMVGETNAAGPTLKNLQSEFGLQPLIDKPLAIISDARLSGKIDAMSLLEVLLTITGEDALTINRKGLPMLTMTLPTRIMISVNEFPRFQDASQALFSRLLLLQLRKSWVAQEDFLLTDRLSEELPGILNWSLIGLRRLRERGRFVQPASAVELLDECRRLVNPMGAFIDDRLEIGSEFEVPTETVWQVWKQWRDQNGIRSLADKASFSRALRSSLPELEIAQISQSNERPRVYRGIRFRDERNRTPPMTGPPRDPENVRT